MLSAERRVNGRIEERTSSSGRESAQISRGRPSLNRPLAVKVVLIGLPEQDGEHEPHQRRERAERVRRQVFEAGRLLDLVGKRDVQEAPVHVKRQPIRGGMRNSTTRSEKLTTMTVNVRRYGDTW